MTRAEISRTYAKLDVYEEIADYIKNVITIVDKRNELSNEELIDYYKQYAESQGCEYLVASSSELTGNILSSFIAWLYTEIVQEINSIEASLPDSLLGDEING